MALDPAWVDMIHTKLVLVYGTRFMQQYAGLQPADVKADWAHELAGMSADGIKHALQNLPRDFPPNVLQFRDLCVRRHTAAPLPQLDAKVHPATKEQIRRLREAAACTRGPRDVLATARAMRERELRGERLSMAQRHWWRDVFKAKGLEGQA